ncbi:MAG TPA: acyl-CoA dehydratase activase [Clostridia bacterium]
MMTVGIDLGSRSVKIAVFENDSLEDYKIYDTAKFYRDFCKTLEGSVRIDFKSLCLEDFDSLVSTGYGRNNLKVDGAKVINELKAHTYGAVWQTGLQNFVLLDVGGQDSKVVSVVNGRMADIHLNDKCAASCGRYLENMSAVLGMNMNEMSSYYEEPVSLSSTCAVFAESELIGRMSEGINIKSLAAGVNYSLFKRVKPLLDRVKGDCLVVTGGVAGNQAFIKYAKEEMGYKEVIVPRYNQLNGAIGCCVYSSKK